MCLLDVTAGQRRTMKRYDLALSKDVCLTEVVGRGVMRGDALFIPGCSCTPYKLVINI